jgi:hypothetical protein
MLSVIYAECHIKAIWGECRYAEYCSVECRYAECRYAECRYAECRSAGSIYCGHRQYQVRPWFKPLN